MSDRTSLIGGLGALACAVLVFLLGMPPNGAGETGAPSVSDALSLRAWRTSSQFWTDFQDLSFSEGVPKLSLDRRLIAIGESVDAGQQDVSRMQQEFAAKNDEAHTSLSVAFASLVGEGEFARAHDALYHLEIDQKRLKFFNQLHLEHREHVDIITQSYDAFETKPLHCFIQMQDDLSSLRRSLSEITITTRHQHFGRTSSSGEKHWERELGQAEDYILGGFDTSNPLDQAAFALSAIKTIAAIKNDRDSISSKP